MKEKETKEDEERLKREADEELDFELEQTFPASDPLKVTRVPFEHAHTPEKDEKKQ